jgi:hypothetical protein
MYQDAKNFTRNGTELQKLDLETARLSILSGDHPTGLDLLASVRDNTTAGNA